MKKLIFERKTKFSIICLFILALLLMTCGLFSALNNKKAVAEDSEVLPTYFAPLSDTEYYGLNSPYDFYYSDSVSAIIEHKASQDSLVLHCDGKFTEIDASQLVCVNMLNDDTLLFSSAARIQKIYLPDFNPSAPQFSELSVESTNPAIASFDLNENYLVGAYQSTFGIFEITSDGTLKEITTERITLDLDSQVAINDNNQIFFAFDNTIYSLTIPTDNDISKVTKVPLTTLGVKAKPSEIIADEEFIYYIESDKIYKLPVSGGTPIELTAENSLGFELGSIVSPKGLCLKNGNLLISDSNLNAVSEFKINQSTLEFTGFAISKGASAYNRIGLNAKKVSNYNGKVGILDDKKLMVVDSDAIDYSKQNYLNYIFPEGSEFKADAFTLGNGTALLMSINANAIQLLDLKASTPSVILEKTINEGTFTQEIADVCYINGIYYILKINKLPQNRIQAVLVAIDENSPNNEPEIILLDENDTFTNSTKITVDVFGNFYLSGQDNQLYKFSKADSGYEKAATGYQIDASTLIELSSDLTGTVYALYSDKIDYFAYNVKGSTSFELNVNESKINAKSFAMNFDEKSVYFIAEGEGVLFETKLLPNVSVSDVNIPSEYIVTDTNASIDNIEFYSAREGAISYIVSIKEGQSTFNYKEIYCPENNSEFVYICSTFLSPSPSIPQSEFLVLAGKRTVIDKNNIAVEEDITVLLNKLDSLRSDIQVLDTQEKKAYVATGVSAYYLPIMTKQDVYVLSHNNSSIRLQKETEIKPLKEVTVFNKTFYFAEFDIEGTAHTGYIPKDFTVLKLYQDGEEKSYSIEKVDKTFVYADKLLNDKVYSLDEGTEIRVYLVEGDVAFIGYKVGDNWAEGYILASSIKQAPNTVIRNILIFICVAIAVCATSVYFILKKR